ncbi:MAG: hypothetical protein M0R70_12820 [Nitrospirae bacterium]|nr:hypothetical protein [Nitrospirota bacterium]
MTSREYKNQQQTELNEAVPAAIMQMVLIVIIAIAIVVFLSLTTVHAGETRLSNLETFHTISTLDKLQKTLYLTVLAAVDYHQTVRSVIDQPLKYHEMNPVLGEHPSRAALAVFGTVGIAATALISRIDHPLARIVVDSIIATEQVNVWENEHTMDRRTSMPIMVVFSMSY